MHEMNQLISTWKQHRKQCLDLEDHLGHDVYLKQQDFALGRQHL